MSDLLRVAVLGTEQSPRGRTESGTDADALIDALGLVAARSESEPRMPREDGARERDLLLRAGAAQLLRRAGARPVTWRAPISRAGEETWQRARPGLSALLAGFFTAGEAELLSEALEGMAEANVRLPEQLLPKALDERDPEVRARLLPVLGERGRWLAEQGLHEAWAWARAGSAEAELRGNAEALWSEGTVAERERLLTRIRSSAPERGRALVESSFKQDKPEQRQRWLELLEIGLSPADAPFLEAALADRSAAVRLRAARVLLRLPGSRTAESARVRVDALLDPGLRLELPKEPFDPALERLGILEAAPPGVGKRQWWLAQLLAALPPEYFEKRTGLAPAELVGRARSHELNRVLLEGFTSGALRFDARAWLAPLWDAWFHEEEAAKPWLTTRPLLALSERLVTSGLESELEPRLVRAVESERHLYALSALPRLWPRALAVACLKQVLVRPRAFVGLLPTIAARIPIALDQPAFTPAPPSEGRREPFEAVLERFRAVLEVRRELLLEIEAHRDLGRPHQQGNPYE